MSKLSTFLNARYPWQNSKRDAVVKHIEDMWTKFEPHADAHFIPEISSGDEGKFQQRYWEMLLGCWFLDQGLRLLPHRDKGPDLIVEYNGSRIFFEAVAPGPGTTADRVQELVPQRLGEEPLKVNRVPDKEMLLRWTTAFHEKFKRFFEYLQGGIVQPSDACVIAINSAQINPFFGFRGISTYPAALETVYPIGCQQVTFHLEQPEKTTTGLQYRPAIEKANKSQVATTPFINPEYAMISAVLATHKDDNHILNSPKPYILVHNLLARNPIPHGLLPVGSEYWLEQGEAEYKIRSSGAYFDS